ncbi:MAG TPA: twin-arginine translocase subunit TatC [Chthoniobacteraceae bacterium]|nr:twin-arginine translocase subunit TatC [Chthoniobacteraceae bacterium]
MWIDKIFKFRARPDEAGGDATKPFLDHMEDLRWMLVRMAISVVAAMMLCFCFRHELVHLLMRPLLLVDPHATLRTLKPTDSITSSLQLSFYAGIVISFPLLLFFFARFVLPALTLKEKKYVLPCIGVGFGLFLTGVLFCYFVILPRALQWMWQDTVGLQWSTDWTAPLYFSFVTQITLVFGLAFELPVAVLGLVYFGVLSFAFLNRTRAYALVIILVLAMIIAPSPDIITFLSLGGPMYLLYEVCIWLAWFMEKRQKKLPE